MIWIIPIVIALSLAASLFVETSSWWIRALSSQGKIGHFISRANIYLYGGRFFALIFSVLLAMKIEDSTPPQSIANLLGASFVFAALFQMATLNASRVTFWILSLLTWVLWLPRDSVRLFMEAERTAKDTSLTIATAVSAFFFGLGLGMPLLLASIFPENRLVISNVGQLINSAGMILILFFVDQRLYLSFDNGRLPAMVFHYTHGRALGCGCAGLVFFISGQFVS